MSKGFSKQLSECRENGTLIREYCYHCNHLLLCCTKYGGLCHSKKCKKERRDNE